MMMGWGRKGWKKKHTQASEPTHKLWQFYERNTARRANGFIISS